jgi:sugar porter (SP) family MFS transporter
LKIKGFLLRSALVAALGGLLFGFDTAVISGAEQALRDVFSENYIKLANLLGFGSGGFWHGFTCATAIIGTIIGSIIIGKLADRHGRRQMLFIIGLMYFVSAVGSGLAWNWMSFSLFRFLGGLAVGGSSVVAPMYIAEISPASIRGRFVAITQFNVIFGILLAYVSNYIVGSFDLGAIEWRWMFGVEAFPALAFFFLLFSTPRSPRWLLTRGMEEEARDTLNRVGTDHDSVDEEINEIKVSLDMEHHSLNEPFFCKKYSKPILLAVMIAIFNQLSGINAILYYAPRIFKMAGFAEGLLTSTAVGFSMLIFTVLALVVIDHFGRRKLMIAGSIGYIISLGAIAWAFYTYGADFKAFVENGTPVSGAGSQVVLWGLIAFVAAHGFGQGAVIWVFISEVFPNRIRARGQALGSFTHWFMAAVISWSFPMFAEINVGHIFVFYFICMVLQLLWSMFIMPETKNISLEEMEKKLGIVD